MTARDSRVARARRTWQLMFDYLVRTSSARTRELGAHGLTPNDSRALFALDAKHGTPIGTLARAWSCDPSNATFIIDRLERAGLAERKPDPDDRRVKRVFLTGRGARTKQRLLEAFHEPPPGFEALDRADLEALERILQRLSPAGDGEPHD